MSYTKRILHVDLSTGKTEIEPLKEEMARKYIGGIGLGMRLFLDNSKAGVDPFSPENPIIFATGPLSGTMAPSAGNGYAVVSKSPLTEGIAESKSHGFFGAELKRAGYDAVIFTGKSEKLVYAWIDDDSVQLMDAQHLKGKSPHETEMAIREDLGDFYTRVTAIGEAGEKLVRIGCAINDEFRAVGRTGMGAVMGSKNLKAVAVRGTNDVNVAKPEEFTEFIRMIHERMKGPVYVTVDIDSVDPAYAPGTGTPEVGGLSSYQLLQLVRGLHGLNLVGFDLVEVSPPFDHGDITAILASNIAFEYLSLLALKNG